MQPVYINGAARIGANLSADAASSTIHIEEPDYTEYIDKRKLRRMDRLSRFALHTTYAALEQGKQDSIDGVIMGVGQTISQINDSMIRKMIEQQEGLTNPTSFMNSLLSTAAGQIALQLTCNGYTNTHTQRGFSTESSLLDAALQLRNEPDQNIVVGGLDVVSKEAYEGLSKQYGHLASDPSVATDRSIGEGAATFLVSGMPTSETQACLRSIFTVFLTEAAIKNWSDQELQQALFEGAPPEVDLIISGRPDGNEAQGSYNSILAAFGPEIPVMGYKSKIGEFPTASAHGLYLAVKELSGKTESSRSDSPERVLVINNYGERYLSAFLVTRP